MNKVLVSAMIRNCRAQTFRIGDFAAMTLYTDFEDALVNLLSATTEEEVDEHLTLLSACGCPGRFSSQAEDYCEPSIWGKKFPGTEQPKFEGWKNPMCLLCWKNFLSVGPQEEQQDTQPTA